MVQLYGPCESNSKNKPSFSYSFNLLVVHFCQTRNPPILPVIQKDAPEINLHTSLKALPMLIKTLPQVPNMTHII